ncbi:MAG: VCBS repeat-containing protein [Planctomycetota bacterium]
MRIFFLTFASTLFLSAQLLPAQLRFKTEELATRIEAGQSVRTADINQDGKVDICVVDSKRILWLENPTWKEHVILSSKVELKDVCIEPRDFDRNGKMDLAVGVEWRSDIPNPRAVVGKLENTGEEPWKFHPARKQTADHSIHWVDLDHNGRPWLVVSEIKDSTEASLEERKIRLLAIQPSAPGKLWTTRVLWDSLQLLYRFDPKDFLEGNKMPLATRAYMPAEILTKNQREALLQLANSRVPILPKRGAGQVRPGHLHDGSPFLAVAQTEADNRLVIYYPTAWQQSVQPWISTKIDSKNARAQVLACGNLDQDKEHEIIVGVRETEKDTRSVDGLRVYDQKTPKREWLRIQLDSNGGTLADLTIADLDQDGDNEIIALGKSPANLKIYWNERP